MTGRPGAWRPSRPLLASRQVRWLVLAATVLLLPVVSLGLARSAAGELPRIGVPLFAPLTATVQDGFRQGLREQGHVEGPPP